MGIIFRVAYNNRGWSGKCINASNDSLLFKCKNGIVFIGYGKFKIDDEGSCISECSESTLCSDYIWENFLGDYNTRKAYGNAYFVFPAQDNSLTFWGKTAVKNVIGSRIYFNQFKPLSEDKWIKGIRAIAFLGKPWGSGIHRYLSEQQESKLLELLHR